MVSQLRYFFTLICISRRKFIDCLPHDIIQIVAQSIPNCGDNGTWIHRKGCRFSKKKSRDSSRKEVCRYPDEQGLSTRFTWDPRGRLFCRGTTHMDRTATLLANCKQFLCNITPPCHYGIRIPYLCQVTMTSVIYDLSPVCWYTSVIAFIACILFLYACIHQSVSPPTLHTWNLFTNYYYLKFRQGRCRKYFRDAVEARQMPTIRPISV